MPCGLLEYGKPLEFTHTMSAVYSRVSDPDVLRRSWQCLSETFPRSQVLAFGEPEYFDSGWTCSIVMNPKLSSYEPVTSWGAFQLFVNPIVKEE